MSTTYHEARTKKNLLQNKLQHQDNTSISMPFRSSKVQYRLMDSTCRQSVDSHFLDVASPFHRTLNGNSAASSPPNYRPTQAWWRRFSFPTQEWTEKERLENIEEDEVLTDQQMRRSKLIAGALGVSSVILALLFMLFLGYRSVESGGGQVWPLQRREDI